MYKVIGNTSEKIESTTFADLKMTEADLEEILRKNIDIICDEEESMLIIGSQVQNKSYGRSDLVALDDQGNIVLIEIKRDKKDIVSRRESFEFQAIRYAASYATILSKEELINKIYVPYILKFESEYKVNELTLEEYANRLVEDFLERNYSVNNFNKKQRIILAASSFDEQTLSAVSWLSSNNVDISCYQLIPYHINGELIINSVKILPVAENKDLFVDLLDRKVSNKTTNRSRKNLPRIKDMLSWGVIKEGDILYAKDFSKSKVTLLNNGNVLLENNEVSISKWLLSLYEWSSIRTYVFAVHEKSGKTLSEMRTDYMKKNNISD